MEINTMKDLSLEYMMEYIENEAPDFKADFKAAALLENEKGEVKYNSAKAKRAFCAKFMPELLPKKKEPKKTKTQILQEW